MYLLSIGIAPAFILTSFNVAAYFSQQKLDSLDTVDNIRGVGDVSVPEGLFRSGRAGKSRGREIDSVRAPCLNLTAAIGSSRTPHAHDQPSFSAFYSTPPDAAIRMFLLGLFAMLQCLNS